MIERREGTSTGEDVVHSFGDDNVARGEEGVDFIKRFPTFPWGDNPRGRELDYENQDAPGESYASKNPVYRAYKGKAPLEGQNFRNPVLTAALPKIIHLRPNLPPLSTDDFHMDIAKNIERDNLANSEFFALFPTATIESPAPGTNVSPGSEITIRVHGRALRNITSATLIVDNKVVDQRYVDRRDQGVAYDKEFIFIYRVPDQHPLGPMNITARVFNISTSALGMIASAAKNDPPQGDGTQTGVGTLDGRLGQSDGSQIRPPLLEQTYFLRTPEGVANISVNVV
jgi:hypothetical protein